MVGVISHVPNPDVEAAVGLAQAAEGAGAAWIGIADAFWWRDVWMLLGEVAWAPLVRHRDAPQASIMHVAVYASLNTVAPVRLGWGLDDTRVEAIREQLVRGDLPAAAALVPPEALEDLVFEDPDPAPIAAVARRLGVSSLAVPGFDPATLAGHIAWAASVEALLD